MRHIAYRRLLPIALLLLSAGLLFVEKTRRKAQEAEREYQRAAHAASTTNVQGDSLSSQGGWDLVTDVPTPIESQITAGINYPGVLLSLPILALLSVLFGWEHWSLYLGASVGIVLFWYLVGRSIDRRRGLLPSLTPRLPNALVRVLTWVSLAVCVPVALLMFFLFVDGLIHPMGWHGRDYHFEVAGFAGWLTVAAAYCAFKLRKWRALARAAASNVQT